MGRRAGGLDPATENGLSSEFPTHGFFAKSMDGRIDDPKGAGKAKGCVNVRDRTLGT